MKIRNHPFGDKITSPVILKKRKAKKRTKVTTKKFRNFDLIQLHLKLQKDLKNKKVSKKGEYYFAKGFKVLLSCAENNRSRLLVRCYQNLFHRGCVYAYGIIKCNATRNLEQIAPDKVQRGGTDNIRTGTK